MPHLIVEYSDNIIEKDQFSALFECCHEVLSKRLPTELQSCKSRAYACTHYFVGEGAQDNAFISVHLKVKPGRSEAVLEEVGQGILYLFEQHFAQSLSALSVELSIEISELSAPYLKHLSQ